MNKITIDLYGDGHFMKRCAMRGTIIAKCGAFGGGVGWGGEVWSIQDEEYNDARLRLCTSLYCNILFFGNKVYHLLKNKHIANFTCKSLVKTCWIVGRTIVIIKDQQKNSNDNNKSPKLYLSMSKKWNGKKKKLFIIANYNI